MRIRGFGVTKKFFAKPRFELNTGMGNEIEPFGRAI
jgi:hypothetical protein